MDIARDDQQKRKVVVNRLQLIDTLESNKAKHVADYQEAKAVYRDVLLERINESFDKARLDLEKSHKKAVSRVSELSDEDIATQSDRITVVDSVTVEMKVPRSYAAEYDAAIDMAKFDVRDTLELSYAEFNCFVRDQWDWKGRFDQISVMYKTMRK